MPDAIILQLGLAEGAPRLFRKNGFEHFMMNKILTRKLLHKYINYIKLRRVRKPELANTPPEVFKKNVESFIMRCINLDTNLFIIKILRATDLYISKSPYIQTSIDIYNNIYSELSFKYKNVTLLDPIKNFNDINNLCIDELHINKDGHILYFNEVKECLLDFFD